jgi:hypothetical protein
MSHRPAVEARTCHRTACYIRPSDEKGACHSLLALRKNELSNSTFGIIVAPMILLVPVRILDSIVGRSIDVVLYALMSGDFVSSNAVEKLVLFSDREAIGVHPSTPYAMESFVQVLLVVLAALD